MNQNPILGIRASIVLLQANQATLKAVILAISNHIGCKEIDGVPIQSWIDQKRLEELQDSLCVIEGMDRDLAIALSEQIDAIRRQTPGYSSGEDTTLSSGA